MRRRANKEPDLFASIGHNGAPPRSRESRRLYTAVLFLRIYGGCNVWRVGNQHLVGARQVSTGQLLQLTAAECRKTCGGAEIPPYALHRLGMT